MRSKWKVSSQYIGDEKMYIALRICDTSQPQHGGNVETKGTYTTDRDSVQALVDKLNGVDVGIECKDLEQWRRFEVIAKNKDEMSRCEKLLKDKKINRQELALILFCLRIRPEFSREDFGI